jgi:hypothetical protein
VKRVGIILQTSRVLWELLALSSRTTVSTAEAQVTKEGWAGVETETEAWEARTAKGRNSRAKPGVPWRRGGMLRVRQICQT